MSGKTIVLSWILIAFALDCSAQTLADVARQERERQRRLHSVVVVANGATTVTAASTSSTAASTTPPAVGAAAAPVGPTDHNGHDEKYWRERFQKARDDVKHAEDRIQLLDLKVKELNTELLNRSDIYNREYRIYPQITETQKELDDAHNQAEQAKQKITDLEDDLRRAGGPPGWAR